MEASTIRLGGRLYPSSLGRLADAPHLLRLVGSLGTRPRVAVVGCRLADEYGLDLARSISAGLARAGVTIVSGGALGIDAAAHEAALEVGGHTVVVLGTGIDVVYPASHRSLFERIVESGGALVSEQPDGAPGLKHHFPRRNRIISGLSDAVVVVRAGERSGALITADWAKAQGVAVLAVPGDVRDPLSAGTTGLLRAGARVAASAEDVLAVIGLDAPPERQLSLPELGAEESALLAALARRPRHANDVARGAGLAPGAALAGLLALELQGLCEQRPGQYFLRR